MSEVDYCHLCIGPNHPPAHRKLAHLHGLSVAYYEKLHEHVIQYMYPEIVVIFRETSRHISNPDTQHGKV